MTTSSPSVEGSPTPASLTDRILAYEALIRGLAGMEGFRYRSIAILGRICTSAEVIADRQRKCEDAFSEAEQAILLERLSDVIASRVTFVEGWEDLEDLPGGRPVFLWVGPLEPHGNSFWVGGGMICGNLCGHGGTFVIKGRDSGWVFKGPAPGTATWIS